MITDEDYENPWIYKGERFSIPDDELEMYTGFVYIIEALAPEIKGKKYVGQKLLWSKKKPPKPKPGAKKQPRKKVPSDWKKYYGSSEEFKEFVAKYGENNFKRTILRLCKTKSEMNYIELKEQIDRRVLFRDDYVNAFLGTKIHKRNVTSLREPRDSQKE